MNRDQFLRQLRKRLKALPEEDVQKQLQYYSEMIDDRMEDGMTEEAAVAAMELPEQPKNERKRLPVWAVILLILGSPVWLSLFIALVAVILALYIVLWAVVIVLHTVPITLGACAVGCTAMAVVSIFKDCGFPLLMWLGSGMVCAGLCMLTGHLCVQLTKHSARFTKWSILALLARKERS